MRSLLLFVLLTILLFSGTGCSASSNDSLISSIPSEVIAAADAYIIDRTGEEFFRNYIKQDAGGSIADSPYYHVKYKFQMPGKPYINEVIIISADRSGNINENTSFAGIPGCLRDSSLCSFNIDAAGVKIIAEERGLQEGIKEWKLDFKWDSKFNRYVWEIISTLYEAEGSNGKTGNGKRMVIDPSTGEVLDESEWKVR